MGDEATSRPYRHFALIYVDRNGNLRQEASDSVAPDRDRILSPSVRDAFLGAVANSREPRPPRSRGNVEPPMRRSTLNMRAPSRVSQQQNPEYHHSSRSEPIITARNSIISSPIQGPVIEPDSSRTRYERENRWPNPQTHSPKAQDIAKENSKAITDDKAWISVRNQDFLRMYYAAAFKKLQQFNCRIVAKAYIKAVEPRKQVNYPYNGKRVVNGFAQQFTSSETKPPWWPHGVSHKEPDHLPKKERVILLVHLLCELHTTHGITAQRLKESDQPIRRQINPQDRLSVLDEIYEVRQEEENYINGITDGRALIPISRANLPDPEETSHLTKNNIPERASMHQFETAEMAPFQSRPPRLMHGQKRTASHELPTTPNMASFPPSGSLYHNNGAVSLQTGFGPATASPPKDLRRKRQMEEVEFSDSISPTSIGFSDLTFAGPANFVSDSFSQSREFHPMGIQATAPPDGGSFGGAMDPYALEYLFNS